MRCSNFVVIQPPRRRWRAALAGMSGPIRPHGKTEPIPYAKRPAGVSQLGYSVGDHVTNRAGSTGYKGEAMDRGPGYKPPGMISDPVRAVGVGGGRTIYKTGYQDQHGSANPGNAPAKGTDILSQFGPDYKAPR